MKRRVRQFGRGFSLIEAIIAMWILSFAASGVLLPFVKGATIRAEGIHQSLSANLANELMELVLRNDYDTILDSYNGFKQQQGQIRRITGFAHSDDRYANFSREVICEEVYLSPENGLCDPKYMRVTVKVCYKGREMVNLQRLVCR